MTKVKEFLEKQELKEEKDNAYLRKEVLSRYNLGEFVYYRDHKDEDISNFPLVGGGFGNERYRYECNISDEEFDKIYKMYKKEQEDRFSEDLANRTKNISIIFLVLGWLSVIVGFILSSFNDWNALFIFDGLITLFITYFMSSLLDGVIGIYKEIRKVNKEVRGY